LTDVWPSVARSVEQQLARPSAPWAKLARRLPRPYPRGVYVLAYHSVPDPREHEPWETHYERVRTWLDDFERHLELLVRRLEPLPLAQAAERLAHGSLERPALVVTFDDGYANLAHGAADVCERHGIAPTVFVSADFASGRAVYHRVLLAVLEGEGHGKRVAELLGADYGATDLLGQTRARYTPAETEEAVLDAWRASQGDTPWPRPHLTFEELRGLVGRGWTVGNHTLSHLRLHGLTGAELDRQIAENQAELEREGLSPLGWLAYPNGGARDVDAAVARWLADHPEYSGTFGVGGVNLTPSRTEWLRIAVAGQSAGQLGRLVWRHLEATRAAGRSVARARPE
jgi:peptidoglycan/xylan/chitin deacetylase (PgdA/CDA1 family)